ncbi:hypothetical protein BD309DRAFT_45211 [Dichomitus squalens]|uniref:Uncharacterized protein n=1 Tax=Dichomitus squalens TaxID=114155 RepID=A0A4Q9PXE7_9APHY|nr:hypothetical protein BD309DRAFT_45211 [Dichomitus squalens]TBU59200.1 hypothetical protein BD310DRAFT_424649 [Dichomitus squalens]
MHTRVRPHFHIPHGHRSSYADFTSEYPGLVFLYLYPGSVLTFLLGLARYLHPPSGPMCLFASIVNLHTCPLVLSLVSWLRFDPIYILYEYSCPVTFYSGIPCSQAVYPTRPTFSLYSI